MTQIVLGDEERRNLREGVYPFAEATPLNHIEEIVDEVQQATKVRMLQKFSIWLLQRANNDSSRAKRQTKAYALWLRFTQEHPEALPEKDKQ